jgi:hypothetical protein
MKNNILVVENWDASLIKLHSTAKTAEKTY